MRRNDIKCKYVLSPLRNSARKGLNEHSSGIEWYQSISMTTNSCMQGVMQYTSAAENASLFCKFHHEVYTRFKCFPITDKKPFTQQHHAFAVQYDAFNVNTGVVIWLESLQSTYCYNSYLYNLTHRYFRCTSDYSMREWRRIWRLLVEGEVSDYWQSR